MFKDYYITIYIQGSREYICRYGGRIYQCLCYIARDHRIDTTRNIKYTIVYHLVKVLHPHFHIFKSIVFICYVYFVFCCCCFNRLHSFLCPPIFQCFFDIQSYNIEQHDIRNIFLISDILILVYHMQNNVTMMLLLFLQFFLVFF